MFNDHVNTSVGFDTTSCSVADILYSEILLHVLYNYHFGPQSTPDRENMPSQKQSLYMMTSL